MTSSHCFSGGAVALCRGCAHEALACSRFPEPEQPNPTAFGLPSDPATFVLRRLWLEKQERAFTVWLNHVLTPAPDGPADGDASASDDASGAWRQPAAPTPCSTGQRVTVHARQVESATTSSFDWAAASLRTRGARCGGCTAGTLVLTMGSFWH